jgi:RNAse (barnase) inhibitor barstar
MRFMELDARNWATIDDFYAALLTSVGAPEWHGRNANALVDSMIWGGINAVEPPYTIRIHNTNDLPKAVAGAIEQAQFALADARADFNRQEGHDVEVQLEIAN